MADSPAANVRDCVVWSRNSPLRLRGSKPSWMAFSPRVSTMVAEAWEKGIPPAKHAVIETVRGCEETGTPGKDIEVSPDPGFTSKVREMVDISGPDISMTINAVSGWRSLAPASSGSSARESGKLKD